MTTKKLLIKKPDYKPLSNSSIKLTPLECGGLLERQIFIIDEYLISKHPMNKSREIRWFSRQLSGEVLRWFEEEKKLSFSSVKPRVDHYLLLNNGIGDQTIKLREGKLEVKERITVTEKLAISRMVTGYPEVWTKWSFSLKKDEPLAGTIERGAIAKWMEVKKERFGIKVLSSDKFGNHSKDISELIDGEGFQIEYTRIYLNGDKLPWYSFAIETFGENLPQFDHALIRNILSGADFKLEDSMGYGEFLMKLTSA